MAISGAPPGGVQEQAGSPDPLAKLLEMDYTNQMHFLFFCITKLV
jgi:hypothetical protein